MKKKRWIKLIGLAALTAHFMLFSLNFIQAQNPIYPSTKELIKRTNYLERVIQQPLNAESEIQQLGNYFYEWMLFSYSFSSYAFTNLAIENVSYKEQAILNMKTSIERVLNPGIASYYNIVPSKLYADSIPAYSVLYLGHLNLMLGCYRLLSQENTFNVLHDNISTSLFKRYSASKFLNLESYPYSIWIPDNSVAMASLKLHSEITGSRYGPLCSKWVDYARKHFIEKETGVLCSRVNPENGQQAEEARGSMLAWSIMFIYQFDCDFAIELYQNYKKNFSRSYIIFRLFRERYKNKETNMGDVDSGPLFRGYSIPANEFALSNAVLAGDFKTARKLKRLIGFGTRKSHKNNELKYKVRFIDMNISPMAEALVLHSLTMTKWVEE